MKEGKDEREKIRKNARRVGLALPEFADLQYNEQRPSPALAYHTKESSDPK